MFPELSSVLKTNKGFYLPFLVFLMLGTIVVCLVPKADSFLWLNQFHHPFFDRIFPYATHLGDGKLGLLLLLGLLLVNYRLALTATVCFLLVLVLTQVGKLVIFEDVLRPAGHFRELDLPIRLVEGVQMHYNNSFPSGHSASAFGLYSFLALIIPAKKWGWLLFAVALFAAYSRIYLSQHFFNDVYVGSFIGAACTLLGYVWMHEKVFKTPKNWHNKGLLRRK